jgi:hypothetical protein
LFALYNRKMEFRSLNFVHRRRSKHHEQNVYAREIALNNEKQLLVLLVHDDSVCVVPTNGTKPWRVVSSDWHALSDVQPSMEQDEFWIARNNSNRFYPELAAIELVGYGWKDDVREATIQLTLTLPTHRIAQFKVDELRMRVYFTSECIGLFYVSYDAATFNQIVKIPYAAEGWMIDGDMIIVGDFLVAVAQKVEYEDFQPAKLVVFQLKSLQQVFETVDTFMDVSNFVVNTTDVTLKVNASEGLASWQLLPTGELTNFKKVNINFMRGGVFYPFPQITLFGGKTQTDAVGFYVWTEGQPDQLKITKASDLCNVKQ